MGSSKQKNKERRDNVLREAKYIPESEITNATQKRGFNGLSPTEWAVLSKNVWNDLSSPRNKHQLQHGAIPVLKLGKE